MKKQILLSSLKILTLSFGLLFLGCQQESVEDTTPSYTPPIIEKCEECVPTKITKSDLDNTKRGTIDIYYDGDCKLVDMEGYNNVLWKKINDSIYANANDTLLIDLLGKAIKNISGDSTFLLEYKYNNTGRIIEIISTPLYSGTISNDYNTTLKIKYEEGVIYATLKSNIDSVVISEYTYYHHNVKNPDLLNGQMTLRSKGTAAPQHPYDMGHFIPDVAIDSAICKHYWVGDGRLASIHKLNNSYIYNSKGFPKKITHTYKVEWAGYFGTLNDDKEDIYTTEYEYGCE